MHELTIEQLADLPESTYALYDIRDDISFSYGTIPGCESANDIVTLAEQKRLPADKRIVLFCMHGLQSIEACEKNCASSDTMPSA